jgi:ABC-type uncharacterized transport system permease subunit
MEATNIDTTIAVPDLMPERTLGPLEQIRAQRDKLIAKIPEPLQGVLSFAVSLMLAMLVFAVVLLVLGKNPVQVYSDIYQKVILNSRNWAEVVVKMTPFILCALAVAIPAQVGLVNVGGEGQIYIGALAATWVGLTFGSLPAPIVVPMMIIGGCVGGALWGGLVGIMRAIVGLNETICSLLLSYVASLLVNFFVFGPWKDPTAQGGTYSAEFSDTATLFTFGTTRISLGIVFALVALGLYFWFFKYTRWGYKMRVIGGNAEAARRSGISVKGNLIAAMMMGGAMAGLSGMVEVTAIQGRLRPEISNGYGYVGFLVAWLAVQKAGRILWMAALLGVIAVAGDVLQLKQIPAAASNVLMALILFFVLSNQSEKTPKVAAIKPAAAPAK